MRWSYYKFSDTDVIGSYRQSEEVPANMSRHPASLDFGDVFTLIQWHVDDNLTIEACIDLLIEFGVVSYPVCVDGRQPVTLANHGVARDTWGVAVEVGHANIPSYKKVLHDVAELQKINPF